MYTLVNDSLENWSASYTGPKFHAVLCDPPYGLEFMGKEWDKLDKAVVSDPAKMGGFQDGSGGNAFSRSRISRTTGFQKQSTAAVRDRFRMWGEALLPHVYPGALVLMFGGTRMWHNLAVGMEDAGFEMWDTLMWLYGTGFPKGQDISKLIDKKNGSSREVIGRRQFADGSFGRETGGDFNGDASVSVDRTHITAPGSSISAPWAGHKTPALKPAWEPILAFRAPTKQTYAALAMEYGSGAINVDGARISVAADDRHEYGVSGDENPKDSAAYGDFARVPYEQHTQGRYPANLILDEGAGAQLNAQSGNRPGCTTPSSAAGPESLFRPGQGSYQKQGPIYPGDGGASRFFYCTKASSKERHAGLEGKNTHPTVKPVALIQYLATLLLPPVSASPRRLLVPFAGSGSEVIGALKAGWDEVVGIEREPDYVQIAEQRVAFHSGVQ